MVEFARRVAPEIDRLVWSISQRIGPGDGPQMSRFVDDRGPAELNRVYHFGDFLAEGRLTRSVALARSRYLPRESTLSLLEEWEAAALIRRDSTGADDPAWIATGALAPVIDEMWSGIGRMAGDQWAAHTDALQTVVPVVEAFMDRLGADHLVAVTHHALTDPDDLPGRAFKRLVTLRYVRQADHIRAWESAGMSAEQIVALTALWNGESAPDRSGGAIDSLSTRGLVDSEGLTVAGRQLREHIEDETDRLDDEIWTRVDPGRRVQFHTAVATLPGTPPGSVG